MTKDHSVEPLLFEISRPNRGNQYLPPLDVPAAPLPTEHVRDDLSLPDVGELDIVRHFTRLSQLNFSIDTNFYPLGSCTMKYNPKINEATARLPGFAWLHPYQPESTVQGALQLMYELQRILAEIAGLPAVTLQPAAGAHGELTGMLIIRAYHEYNGESHRRYVLVPDSAHGTNPATAAMCGYDVIEIPSDERGNMDPDAIEAAVSDEVAGLMLTNPSTLGLFEEHILEITAMLHAAGALVYCDGANMNALLGAAKPGELGCDVLHYNLHKTFTTPHGGGGPGAGATAVSQALAPFLPVPVVAREADTYYLDEDRPQSIGRVRAFYGNFGNMVRGYTYIRQQGRDGLKAVSLNAVLNANYLRVRLQDAFDLPYDRTCMHEVVFSGKRQANAGARTLDIAKRLLDHGFHAPTIYFPLIVEEALMIEPTETESRATLDAFADTLLDIAREVAEEPEIVKEAPHATPVSRLDEVKAARHPDLRWTVPT
jgi:glycine dehydrogenase subunit 2